MSENDPVAEPASRDVDPERPLDLESGLEQPSEENHPDAPIVPSEQQQQQQQQQPVQIQELREEEEDGEDRGGSGDDDDEDSTPPRFLQDQGAWKRWKWVPYSVRRVGRAVVKWCKGPANARDYKIEPIFPDVQHAPLVLLDRFVPGRRDRIYLAVGWFALWLLTFVIVLQQGRAATEIEGWGAPVPIGCGNAYWMSGNGCGLDGNNCRPFNGSGFAFKCPAECKKYEILNYRAVGDQEIIYRPLVIGGPPSPDSDENAVYRGDSFICGAAIHAGIIDNTKGGCGVVNLVGTQVDYAGSDRHGIKSVAFDSYFPLSFVFDHGVECESRDMRWPLLTVSVIFTVGLSLFTTSPALFYFGSFVMIFWTVGMATDPPNIADLTALFSNELGKFLPAMLAGWVIYDKMGVRRALNGLTAQVEKTVLWLGGCWVGALTNYTFDFIPIQRLTPHDLQQQPGALVALTIIIIILALIFAKQVVYFRQEGRLIKYLKLYGLFVAGIVVCLLLPNLKLRIHHYILALLLLPGTSMQTRPALLYQGILVGFFVNGIARWGWDSVLQTWYELRGDAHLGSPLPTILDPVVELGRNLSSITFSWDKPPAPVYDGISVLVNDVERFRSYFSDAAAAAAGVVSSVIVSSLAGGNSSKTPTTTFTWTRSHDVAENEYFRFAWMQGSSTEDYTMAGTWDSQGDWIHMLPGPSRVRARAVDGEVRVSSDVE